MARAVAGDSDIARKVGCGSGAAVTVIFGGGSDGGSGHGGAKISGGEDGGGAAALVLLLDDEATVDDGTGGLREGGLEVEGNHTHPLSEEGEHGDIREVVADTEADDRRGIGKGAKSGEARGGDAVGLRSLSRSDKTVIGQWKEKKE
ncbi:hypothetical protein BHM03_00055364 [Ensete ventricosum]|nr:hypothetical protein BHM03_00055364 [Ensete ventricosum]